MKTTPRWLPLLYLPLIIVNIVFIISDKQDEYDRFLWDYSDNRSFLQEADFTHMTHEELSVFCDNIEPMFFDADYVETINSSRNFRQYQKSARNLSDTCRDYSGFSDIPTDGLTSLQKYSDELSTMEFSSYRYFFSHGVHSDNVYNVVIIIVFVLTLFAVWLERRLLKLFADIKITESSARVYTKNQIIRSTKRFRMSPVYIASIMVPCLMWISEGRILLLPGIIFTVLYLILAGGSYFFIKKKHKVDVDGTLEAVMNLESIKDGESYDYNKLNKTLTYTLRQNYAQNNKYMNWIMLVVILGPIAYIILEALLMIMFGINF